MKFIRLILLAAVCIIASCTKEAAKNTAATSITLITDSTEYHKAQPEILPLLALYEFENEISMEAWFRHVYIADRLTVPATEYHLENEMEMEKQNMNNDPQFRERSIISFYNAITGGMDSSPTVQDTSQGLQYSECYRVIANEVKLLMERPEGRRILVIYSDMREKSEVFDMYNGDKSLLKKPDTVIAIFQKACPLPENLYGLQVYLVFQARDRQQDHIYGEVSSIYKRMFEERGAKVTIQSHTDNYN